MVPEFSVLTFGESNKCPNGLTVEMSRLKEPVEVIRAKLVQPICTRVWSELIIMLKNTNLLFLDQYMQIIKH